MALSGACAGTVLVQVSTGIVTGPSVLLGAVIGGTIFSRWGHVLKPAATPAVTGARKSPNTIHESANISEPHAIIVFNALCMLIAISAYTLLPQNASTNPFAAGLGIATAQAASVLLTTNTLGVSTSYEQVGASLWRLLDLATGRASLHDAWPATNAIVFAAGIMGGSFALQRNFGVPTALAVSTGIATSRAILGGVLLGIGSRLAGGCTSGHGISGMATGSKSSFVTVMAMFGGGMGLAWVLS